MKNSQRLAAFARHPLLLLTVFATLTECSVIHVFPHVFGWKGWLLGIFAVAFPYVLTVLYLATWLLRDYRKK